MLIINTLGHLGVQYSVVFTTETLSRIYPGTQSYSWFYMCPSVMFEMILVLLLWACFTPVKLRNIQAYFSACLVWSNTTNITIHCLIFPGRIFKVCYWVSASYMVSSLYYVIGPNMVRTLTWDALSLTSICFLEGRWVIRFYCHAFTLVNKVDLICLIFPHL